MCLQERYICLLYGKMVMGKYNLLVIGLGPAGWSAAYKAAKKGLSVIAIDSSSRPWNKVCGEAIKKAAFDYVGINIPKEAVYQNVDCIRTYAPDENIFYDMHKKDDPSFQGYMVNFTPLSEYLFNLAKDKGAELHTNTTALELLVHENEIKGASVFDKEKELKYDIFADKIFVATGVSGFSNKLPINFEIPNNEMFLAVREKIKLKNLPDDIPLSYLRIYLNQEVSKGGYSWIFPEYEENDSIVANVGVGIIKNAEVNRQTVIGCLEKFKQKHKEIFKDAEKIDHPDFKLGSGLVPVRYPLANFVYGNILIGGDLAKHGSPLHGGGKHSAMIAGTCAANAVIKAQEEGEDSYLHEYNINYHKDYGAKQAADYVYAQSLAKADNKHIVILLKDIIDKEDIKSIGSGEELKLGNLKKFGIAAKVTFKHGSKGVSTLKRVKLLLDTKKEVNALYTRYPKKIEDVFYWEREVNARSTNFKQEIEIIK